MTDNQSSCPCASDKCENMENGYYKEFNVNNLVPSSTFLNDCTKQACKVLNNFIDEKKITWV